MMGCREDEEEQLGGTVLGQGSNVGVQGGRGGTTRLSCLGPGIE